MEKEQTPCRQERSDLDAPWPGGLGGRTMGRGGRQEAARACAAGDAGAVLHYRCGSGIVLRFSAIMGRLLRGSYRSFLSVRFY
jgi:hypothetical protein